MKNIEYLSQINHELILQKSVTILERIMCGIFQLWLPILVSMLMVLRIESVGVDITYVESAVAKGAVCLDGSPPAYHFDKGYEAGANSWLIQMEGGGWCNNVTTCLARKNTQLGSSKQMVQQLAFSGILSNNPQFNPGLHQYSVIRIPIQTIRSNFINLRHNLINCMFLIRTKHWPDFYNWNRIKVRYCDGASFTGDIEAVNPATNLHYRGARVFVAVMEDLFAKGLENAENAILSGCSAGGLASILHCDSFKALFPMVTTVKCFSDAGYFINARDVSGTPHIADFYNDVVRTHGSAKNLPTSCTSRLSPGLCFFPQHVVQGLETPLFVLNTAYDSWQINNILAPGVADPNGIWHNCKLDILKCSGSQLEIMQGFRAEFLYALSKIGSSTSRGYFINSCYAHCQTEMQETWLSAGSPTLNGKTIAEAMGDWFYDRSPFQEIDDCPYPCGETCHNVKLNSIRWYKYIDPNTAGILGV